MRGTNGFRFGGGSTTAFSGFSRFSRFSRREDGRWKMEGGRWKMEDEREKGSIVGEEKMFFGPSWVY